MATKTVAGKTVQVNEEGFMTNPAEWTKEIAVELAKEDDMGELTAVHWKIIDYCRHYASVHEGQAPTPLTITKNTGISVKELFALFPNGPAKRAAHVAGLLKPEGCV